MTTLASTAEATGLDAGSVDTVIAAQAFHWFDPNPALAEIRRILRPGGHLVCVWNVRDTSRPFMREFTELMGAHAGDTAGGDGMAASNRP
ncbi:MAG: class I SAM-dependent methyltransferase [Acidimicrobiales bacterium]